MKTTGIVRKVDPLGRVVIPKEVRKINYFNVNQEVEFYIDGENIIIGKYHKSCIICGDGNGLTKIGDKLICERCIGLVKER